MKEFWEQRYAEDEFAYGKKPNEFLAAQLESLEPGRLLLPAEGEGRNAVWAASIGWQVDAFDYSAEAQKKALRLAKEAGVEINYQIASYNDARIDPSTYDAVALIFAHMPPQLRVSIHQKLAEALEPGGTMIVEAFSKQQLGRSSGGPKDVAMLYSREELASDFAALEIVELSKKEAPLDEGPYHQGTASVLRLVARRR